MSEYGDVFDGESEIFVNTIMNDSVFGGVWIGEHVAKSENFAGECTMTERGMSARVCETKNMYGSLLCVSDHSVMSGDKFGENTHRGICGCGIKWKN